MKKTLLYIIASLGICSGMISCVPEEIINDTDNARHQITDLKCNVDDEEATLSWSVPEGWEPTDYLITFSDAASVQQRIFPRERMNLLSQVCRMTLSTHSMSRQSMVKQYQIELLSRVSL